MTRLLALLLAIALPLAAGSIAASQLDDPEQEEQEQEEAPPEWPKVFLRGDASIALCAPQIEAWHGFTRLEARLAVIVTPAVGAEAIFGAIMLSSATTTDFEEGIVRLERPYLDITFPGVAPDVAEACVQAVREVLPEDDPIDVSLPLLLGMVPDDVRGAVPVEASLAPPTILYRRRPTILLALPPGPLRWEPIGETGIDRAPDASWDLLRRAATGRCALRCGDFWIASDDPDAGPWDPLLDTGPFVDPLADLAEFDRLRAPTALPSKGMPEVIVVREPTELLLTDGAAQFASVPETRLMAITNSETVVMRHIDQGLFYLLAAGRWFRAPSLDGPWSAATTELPEDFARIPVDSEWGDLRASVPGTEEAREALLLAAIPRRAIVRRDSPDLALEVAVPEKGPGFVPIGDTSAEWAANLADDVFRVEDRYYCCRDAIWFESDDITGPWQLCAEVPASLRGIPPEHPAHRTTYAQVYASTPDSIEYGYTMGYDDVVASTAGVLLLGAGLVALVAASDADIRFNVTVNSPTFHMHGSYGSGARYDGGSGGWMVRSSAAGPYFASSAQRANAAAGVAAARRSRYSGWSGGVTERTATRSQGAWSAAPRSGWTAARRAPAAANATFAGRDGSIYRRGADGSWSRRTAGGWSPSSADMRRHLDAEARSRSRGNDALSRAGGRARGGGRSGGRGGGRR